MHLLLGDEFHGDALFPDVFVLSDEVDVVKVEHFLGLVFHVLGLGRAFCHGIDEEGARGFVLGRFLQPGQGVLGFLVQGRLFWRNFLFLGQRNLVQNFLLRSARDQIFGTVFAGVGFLKKSEMYSVK